MGAWLARSWDKQKWMRDNRKQECQELLAAVSEAVTLHLARNLVGGVSLHQTNEAYHQSLKVFHSRLFIAKDVERHKLLDSWAHAVHDFNETADRVKFDASFEQIREQITQMAINS